MLSSPLFVHFQRCGLHLFLCISSAHQPPVPPQERQGTRLTWLVSEQTEHRFDHASRFLHLRLCPLKPGSGNHLHRRSDLLNVPDGFHALRDNLERHEASSVWGTSALTGGRGKYGIASFSFFGRKYAGNRGEKAKKKKTLRFGYSTEFYVLGGVRRRRCTRLDSGFPTDGRIAAQHLQQGARAAKSRHLDRSLLPQTRDYN